MIAPVAMPRLAFGALGGTVSMQSGDAELGVTPVLSGETLLAALPQLGRMAQIHVETLCLVPSASLTFIQLLEVLRWAKSQVESGAVAVVLTQGTDTLEEVAYFLGLLWPYDAPLILTGAMRAASQPGADGPANVLAAVQVALAQSSRGRGAQVVINDQIHAAEHVRKTDSLAMAAFSSAHVGVNGLVVEGQPCYVRPVVARTLLPEPTRWDHRVALLEASLDADTLLLQQVACAGYEGLVIAGFGAGHVSQAWAQRVQTLAKEMAVVIASRAGAGPTARQTYGFAGGEIDLQGKGATMAGFLCPRKCRVLLWLLIGSGMQRELRHFLQPIA